MPLSPQHIIGQQSHVEDRWNKNKTSHTLIITPPVLDNGTQKYKTLVVTTICVFKADVGLEKM